MNPLKAFDPDLAVAISSEALRQEQHLELIASENYASKQVMSLQGSILTNKYAEGYPRRRYYGGCEYVDEVEELAISRAKQLFSADYANVQPHSGSSANAAVMLALLQPGDTILGMGLDQGGHLTHGCPVNFSGKIYQSLAYGLDPKTGDIDYDQVESLAKKHRPKMIIAGFSAFSLTIDWQRFRQIADQIGAYLLADMAHVAGLVATGLYPSPVGIADIITTTTHKTLRGPRGGMILSQARPDIEKKLNSGIFPGSQGGPLMHVIAAKAYAFLEALQPEFKQYQLQVLRNAKVMVDRFLHHGLSIVSGRTDNHLFVLDLQDQGITGKEAESRLEQAFITTNKNTVPNDPQSPFVTSGVRIGTPAITTRGMQEKEMRMIVDWMVQVIQSKRPQQSIEAVRTKVVDLCSAFPVDGGK